MASAFIFDFFLICAFLFILFFSSLSFKYIFHCNHQYPCSTVDVSPQSVLHGDVVS